jgi:glycerate 2-kinase
VEGRALLAEVVREVLADVHGTALTAAALRTDAARSTLRIGTRTIDLRAHRRVVLLGAGKASGAMAVACEEILGDRLSRGLVVTGEGGRYPLRYTDVAFGSHPVPGEDSLRAGEALLACAAALRPDDLSIFLLSGGASALCEALRPGVSLEELQTRTRALLASGAPIEAINQVRRSLSRFKAGGLAEAARARIVTLALSDVASNDPRVIGSGPTVKDDAGDDYFVLADAETLAAAATRRLKQRGLTVVRGPRLEGEAARVGASLAALGDAGTAQARVGETTVTLGDEPGKGGRNQELALAFALSAAGNPDVALAAIGTDGRDGPTDAAGAIVDGATVSRGGPDATAALARHDAYPYLDGAGDLVRTGPTGSNLADLVICIRR